MSVNIAENITISGIPLKNRLIRSATHDGLADENGTPTEKLIRRYAYLAENQVGLIITGYAQCANADGCGVCLSRTVRVFSEAL